MSKKKATSSDVAKRAGVSQATVSMVLNKKYNVSFSRETVEKVEQAARELGYHLPGRKNRKESRKEKLIVVFCPTLTPLAEEGNLEKIKAYLSDAVSRIPSLELHFCENRAADGVVGYYCALAKREQIPFSVRLDLPECLPVDEIDLCLVLSNLLENALEASLHTAPARRRIELTAYLHGNSLALIQVENTYDGVIREKDGVFLSSKRKGDGVGLQSVRHIAEKSCGVSTVTYQDGLFCVKVMLCG